MFFELGEIAGFVLAADDIGLEDVDWRSDAFLFNWGGVTFEFQSSELSRSTELSIPNKTYNWICL